MQSEVTLQGLQPYLSFIGSFIQFGSSLLLIALFLLLRRYARRRRYFQTWSYAWIALSVALFAVMVRYNILPALPGSDGIVPLDSLFRVKLLYFLYQFAKIGFYGLLIAGTLRYVRSAPRFPSQVGFLAFTALYAAFAVWRSGDLNGVVMWQTPIAVGALGYAAYLMGTLPKSRHSLGSVLSSYCFGFGALVWTLYVLGFGLGTNSDANPLIGIIYYNTYLDLAWHLSLGFSMVVLLMEDVKHEVDAAHAELAVAHDNLRRASFYDSVTGSLNRQAFAEGLGLEAARAGFGAVMVLDMDNLKNINDEHGHAAGDSMLRYLVEVLRSQLRASDKLYRWGGDEFLLVFPGADAPHVARRLRSELTGVPSLRLANDSEVQLSVSIGAAAFKSAEELMAAIEAADRAMYADKVSRKRMLEPVVPQSA